MGFGSSGSMNVVMKNNRNLLKKRKRLVNTLGGYDPSKKTEYDFPKSNKRILRDVREKVKRENKEIFIKRIILFSFLVVCLFTGIMYYLF
jgi:hypothetical protein